MSGANMGTIIIKPIPPFLKMTKNDRLKKALGDKLQTMRKSKGLSIRTLAATADIGHSQIVRIEKGEISPSAITIQKIADALEVTPCSFFDC